MTKKQILGSVSFMLVLFMMIVALCDLFALDNNATHNQRFSTYASLNEDTVDAVMIGTSGMDRYWVSAKAYEDYGMTVYPLSYDSCPSWLVLDIMKEALKNQSPELFIIDVRPFVQSNDSYGEIETRARRVIDSMPFFSTNRIVSAFKTMNIIRTVDKTAPRIDFSYLFSVIKYHGKWSEDDYRFGNNWGEVTNKQMGFYMWEGHIIKKTPIIPRGHDDDYMEPLDEICANALSELIEYTKENDIKIMFLDTPQNRIKIDEGRANTIYTILEDENIPYVHYYTEETASGFTIDLDINNDFYNQGHTNYYGAVKFTDAFAKHLNDTYDFPDRRTDEKAKEDWDGCYEGIVRRIKVLEQQKQQNNAQITVPVN